MRTAEPSPDIPTTMSGLAWPNVAAAVVGKEDAVGAVLEASFLPRFPPRGLAGSATASDAIPEVMYSSDKAAPPPPFLAAWASVHVTRLTVPEPLSSSMGPTMSASSNGQPAGVEANAISACKEDMLRIQYQQQGIHLIALTSVKAYWGFSGGSQCKSPLRKAHLDKRRGCSGDEVWCLAAFEQ